IGITLFLIIKRIVATGLFKNIISKKIYAGERNTGNRRLFDKAHKEIIFREMKFNNKRKFKFGPMVEIFFLICIPSLIYIGYLVKIGGDFMFARLFISLSPILFIWMETTLLGIFNKNIKKVVYTLVLLATLFYYNPYSGTKIPVINNISSENDIYRLKDIYTVKNALLPLSSIFRELNVKIAFGGAQAIFAYYTDAPVAIEVSSGLTDAYIARLPVKKRGKIGHEKSVSRKYLRRRGVNISFDSSVVPKTDYNQIFIKGLPHSFSILVYKSRVFSKLYDTDRFQFMLFEDYLDNYLSEVHKRKLIQQKKDYKKFKLYYFNYNKDPQREEYFRQRDPSNQ
ncbi:MAG: hypothetical protein KDK36_05260, partial [Leptospiraceae bacterium]|nr:hypothetical protein [Leptospiraceae bacterium]